MNTKNFIFLSFLFFHSCGPGIMLKKSPSNNPLSLISATGVAGTILVNTLAIKGNNLLIEGQNLNKITQAYVVDETGEKFDLLKSTATKDVSTSLQSQITLLAKKMYTLILIDEAHAQNSYSFTVNVDNSSILKDNAITSAMIVNKTIKAEDLSSMGANDGDLLQWNAGLGKWAPVTLADMISGGAGQDSGIVSNTQFRTGLKSSNSTSTNGTKIQLVSVDVGTSANQLIQLDENASLNLPENHLLLKEKSKLLFQDDTTSKEFSIYTNSSGLLVKDELDNRDLMQFGNDGSVLINGKTVCLQGDTNCIPTVNANGTTNVQQNSNGQVSVGSVIVNSTGTSSLSVPTVTTQQNIIIPNTTQGNYNGIIFQGSGSNDTFIGREAGSNDFIISKANQSNEEIARFSPNGQIELNAQVNIGTDVAAPISGIIQDSYGKEINFVTIQHFFLIFL